MMDKGLSKQQSKSIFKVCLICIAVLLVVSGILAWQGIIRRPSIPKNFGVVQEGQLYRSGLLPSRQAKDILLKYNIKVIIDLAADSPEERGRKAEKRAVAELGIERLTFALQGDGTGDVNDYAEAIAAIVKARQEHKPVLVHCNAGRQRTGGVIAVYQLLVERKSPFLVYCGYMRYVRDPWKNKELFNYINSHMKELAVQLKKMGVISDVPSPLPVFGL